MRRSSRLLFAVPSLAWLATPAVAEFVPSLTVHDACSAHLSFDWRPPAGAADIVFGDIFDEGWQVQINGGPPSQGVRGVRVQLAHTGDCDGDARITLPRQVGFFASPGGPWQLRHLGVDHSDADSQHHDHYAVRLLPPRAGGGPGQLEIHADHLGHLLQNTVGVAVFPPLTIRRAFLTGSYTQEDGTVVKGKRRPMTKGPVPGGSGAVAGVPRQEGKATLGNYTVAVAASPVTETTAAFLGTWEGREAAWELPLGPVTRLLGEEVEPGVFEVRVPLLRRAGAEGELHVFVDLSRWLEREEGVEAGSTIPIEGGRSEALPGIFVSVAEIPLEGPDAIGGAPFSGNVTVAGEIWNRVERAPEESDLPWGLLVVLALLATGALLALRGRGANASP